MKHIIFSALLLSVLSCSEEKQTPEPEVKEVVEHDIITQQDTLTENLVAIEDSVLVPDTYSNLVESPMFFLPEEVVILQTYFTDSSIVVYDSCQVLLVEAKTDIEFGNAYLKLLALRAVLSEQVYDSGLPDENNGSYYPDYVLTAFEPIDEAVLGMQSTCVAECTDFDFTFDLAELKPLALKTTGEMDDLLFQIFDLADGDYGGTGVGWHNWFERTWDYGGASLFGSGIHLELLQSIYELKQQTPMYDDLLLQYQQSIVADISHGIYMRSKEEATAELFKILELTVISEKDKQPLRLLVGNWEKGDGSCNNCVDGIYQFDCANGDCNWGG